MIIDIIIVSYKLYTVAAQRKLFWLGDLLQFSLATPTTDTLLLGGGIDNASKRASSGEEAQSYIPPNVHGYAGLCTFSTELHVLSICYLLLLCASHIAFRLSTLLPLMSPRHGQILLKCSTVMIRGGRYRTGCRTVRSSAQWSLIDAYVTMYIAKSTKTSV